MKKKKNNGIMSRWLVNSLLIMVLVVLALGFVVFFVAQGFYYGGVKQTIYTRNNILMNSVLTTPDTAYKDVSAQIRTLVEDFEDRDKMELMAIDGKGHVVLSSLGYSYSEAYRMPDYDLAVASDNGTGEFIGTYITGERVVAVTVLLPIPNRNFMALRYVVSLQQVDRQIWGAVFLFALFGFGVILIITFSNVSFIRTILRPINEIATSSKQIAAGDFSVRVTNPYDDEVGQLCDSINDMAAELASTEQMKNEFISSVSHELRTPLTAIQGWGETLEDSFGDEKTFQRGMGVIIGETKRLSAMVEELLDFSRIQSGGFTMSFTNTDVVGELTDVVLMFTERATREGKEILFSEPQEFFMVWADKNRLRQVFVNIIDNAMKYTPQGGKIVVTAGSKGDSFIAAVEDTGSGIAPEDLPKVKEKFYKGAGSKRGSGIGLAVCDEIIQRHGGTLTIESQRAKGTKVTVLLPMGKGQERTGENI